jgi:hypothetical protein
MTTTTHPMTASALLGTLILALSTGRAAAQEARLSAETYGRASGDVPAPGLGLVLELVGLESEAPRLRLLGGLPCHPATIVLSAQRPEAPHAGPRGAELLVGPVLHTLHGRFDAHGRFEAPLATLPAGLPVYAQGFHTGLLQLADGPLFQASHGLVLERTVGATEGQLGFDDLLPHLPPQRELRGARDLAELLQTALNSAGDSVRLALELEVTLGLGIEVVDAKAGGKIQLEVVVTRTAAGLYELEVAQDRSVLAGVSAGFGAEVGAEAAGGVGGTSVFEFHSAPGAARGVLGLALALQFPGSQADLEGSALERAFERLADIQLVLVTLRDRSDELEAFLGAVADAQLERAEASLAAAGRRLAAVQQALRAASWRDVPRRAAQVALQRAVVEALRIGVHTARVSRGHAEAALEVVRAAHAAKRAELDRLLEVMARVGRIAATVAQLRGDAVLHYAGWESRYTGALEGEAKLGLPVVDINGLESSVTEELAVQHAVRCEIAREGRPARTTVTSTIEHEIEVIGAVIAGVELNRTRTFELAQSFVESPTGTHSDGVTVSYGVDVCALGTLGALVQRESGLGRAWSVALGGAQHLTPAELATLLSPAALVERLGNVEASLALQDRRQENIELAFAIDVTGNGGGIELAVEWADQGRALERTTTVAEAVQRVVALAPQALDLTTGAVVALD